MTAKEKVLSFYPDAYIKSWFDDNGEWVYCVIIKNKFLGSESKFLDSAWKSALSKMTKK